MSKQEILIPERQPTSPKKKEGESKEVQKSSVPDGAGTAQVGQQFGGMWEKLNMQNPDDNERMNNLKFIYLNVIMSSEKKTFLKNKFEIDDR